MWVGLSAPTVKSFCGQANNRTLSLLRWGRWGAVFMVARFFGTIQIKCMLGSCKVLAMAINGVTFEKHHSLTPLLSPLHYIVDHFHYTCILHVCT